jgi:hypothetical protein
MTSDPRGDREGTANNWTDCRPIDPNSVSKVYVAVGSAVQRTSASVKAEEFARAASSITEEGDAVSPNTSRK